MRNSCLKTLVFTRFFKYFFYHKCLWRSLSKQFLKSQVEQKKYYPNFITPTDKVFQQMSPSNPFFLFHVLKVFIRCIDTIHVLVTYKKQNTCPLFCFIKSKYMPHLITFMFKTKGQITETRRKMQNRERYFPSAGYQS